MPTAAGDDAAPVLRIFPEALTLERIDLISDKAGHHHGGSFAVVSPPCFDYDQSVKSRKAGALSRLAGAIAEPARTRMLGCLLDGHARTSTELAVVAGVSPSTASVHLARLNEQRLVKTLAQGRHRYHTLASAEVAAALEALMIVAGGAPERFVPATPSRLRAARTCYDHMAGAVAVSLHDGLREKRWLAPGSVGDGGYELTPDGAS